MYEDQPQSAFYNNRVSAYTSPEILKACISAQSAPTRCVAILSVEDVPISSYLGIRTHHYKYLFTDSAVENQERRVCDGGLRRLEIRGVGHRGVSK